MWKGDETQAEIDFYYEIDTFPCGCCMCCGCDCYYDSDEDYVEEDEPGLTYWIVKRMEKRDGELIEVGSYGFETEEDGNAFAAENYGDGYIYAAPEEVTD